jgi:replicative DNA helicase
MHTEGKPIDGVSVHERARDSGLEKTLPPGFLMECADSEATAAHAEYYIGVIRTAKQLREVHAEAQRMMDEVTAPGAGPELIASQSASRLSQIVERGTPDSRPSSSQVIDNIIKSAERARNEGIPDVGLSILGIRPLDDITMGLEPGLHVLAARPSNGKTTFEDQLAVYHANRGVGVLRICLDMSEQQLAVRALCRDARISVGKLKYGHYTSEDRTVLIRAGEHAKQRPIWYGALYDISEMERYVRVMVAKHPEIGLLTVDYLQLVQASIMGGRAASNDNARISYVCTRLKEIANTLNLPVLALSQLSRTQGSNKADDKFQKPSLQDLRDSGMIEQAASRARLLAHLGKIHGNLCRHVSNHAFTNSIPTGLAPRITGDPAQNLRAGSWKCSKICQGVEG